VQLPFFCAGHAWKIQKIEFAGQESMFSVLLPVPARPLFFNLTVTAYPRIERRLFPRYEKALVSPGFSPGHFFAAVKTEWQKSF
jgi:hypothetical protein